MAQIKTLIGIQQDYIDTVNGGIARWSHRRDGGHASRIMRGARHRLEASLRKLGFNETEVQYSLKQAREVAELERMATVDE